MKDSTYFKEELDGRTGDLTDEEKKDLTASLDAEKKRDEIKTASETIALSQERKLEYDIETFLVDTLHYKTTVGEIDVLEIQVKDMYMRVSGHLVEDTFIIDEFYINNKPLKEVVHIEDSDTPILKIQWK